MNTTIHYSYNSGHFMYPGRGAFYFSSPIRCGCGQKLRVPLHICAAFYWCYFTNCTSIVLYNMRPDTIKCSQYVEAAMLALASPE